VTEHKLFAFPTGFDLKMRAVCLAKGCGWVSRPGAPRTVWRRAQAHRTAPNVVRSGVLA